MTKVARWERCKVNPLPFFAYFKLPHDHVTYDPTMRREEFYMEFCSRHDGTLIFTYELFCNIVARLANIDAKLTVGPIRLVTVTGQVSLPKLSENRTFHGQRERVRLYFRAYGPLKMRKTVTQPTWPSMFGNTAGYG